jgi:hypothetical protein
VLHLACLYEWQTLLTADVINSFQDARSEWGILNLALLAQTAVIHQIIPGLLNTAFISKGNLRFRQKLLVE